MVGGNTEDRNIRAWQKDVASSIADGVSTTPRDPPPSRSTTSPPLVVNQIVTSPPVVVTRVRAPEPKNPEEISTKAIIGTVVGATAGAFIAYAMVKGDSQNHQQPMAQERVAYRMIEVPAGYEIGQSRPIARAPMLDAHSHDGSFANGNPGARARALTIGPPPPRAETLVPSSARSHRSARSDPRSHQAASQRGPIVFIDNEQDSRSRAASAREMVREEHLARPPPSAPVTEVILARDVPLPARSRPYRYSQASSTTVKAKAHSKAATESRENIPPSVAPDDSISQVSTRISRDNGRPTKRHSSHHGRSKVGSRSERNYRGDRESRAGSKHRSKVGEVMEDVVSMIKGTSIKGSEHRNRH